MKQAKQVYTKGPWRVGDAGHAVFGPKDSGLYPNAPATVVQKLANKANAHLIAAAPEMLETLVLLRAEIEAQGSYGDQENLSLLSKVIAKARGES